MSYSVPAAVRKAARLGLSLRKKQKRGARSGLTTKQAGKLGIGSGVARARDLIKGKVSLETIRRMSSYFRRHRGNYKLDKGKEPEEDRGYVAGLLWGGEAGRKWAASVLKSQRNPPMPQEEMPKKITVAAIKRLFSADGWSLYSPRGAQAYKRRDADIKTRSGRTAVSVTQFRHTGDGKEYFNVAWYTGDPRARWTSKSAPTISSAVRLVNDVMERAELAADGSISHANPSFDRIGDQEMAKKAPTRSRALPRRNGRSRTNRASRNPVEIKAHLPDTTIPLYKIAENLDLFSYVFSESTAYSAERNKKSIVAYILGRTFPTDAAGEAYLQNELENIRRRGFVHFLGVLNYDSLLRAFTLRDHLMQEAQPNPLTDDQHRAAAIRADNLGLAYGAMARSAGSRGEEDTARQYREQQDTYMGASLAHESSLDGYESFDLRDDGAKGWPEREPYGYAEEVERLGVWSASHPKAKPGGRLEGRFLYGAPGENPPPKPDGKWHRIRKTGWGTEWGVHAINGGFAIAMPWAPRKMMADPEGYGARSLEHWERQLGKPVPKGTKYIVASVPSDGDRPVLVSAHKTLDAAKKAGLRGLGYSFPEAKKNKPTGTLLPLASSKKKWSGNAARARLKRFCKLKDGTMSEATLAKAFAHIPAKEDRQKISAYKLPIADVVGGRLVAVPKAIKAADGSLDGARGGVKLNPTQKGKARRVVNAYMAKVERANKGKK